MFITIEGSSEGCGKSTQAKLLYEYLYKIGKGVILTKEPGSTYLKINRAIRKILLDPENAMDPNTELLLYAADRSEHVNKIIKPYLDDKYIVISDRYTDSTMAIQGYGRGLDKNKIRQIITLATEGLKPDLTILINLKPEVGLRRALNDLNCNKRSHGEARFELEQISFHNRVYKGYLNIYQEEPDRFFVVDGKLPVEEIHKKIKNKVNEYL